MRIVFVRGWRNYPPNRPFDFADGMATELVRRGIARRISDPADNAEMAVAGPAMNAETAARRGKRRR